MNIEKSVQFDQFRNLFRFQSQRIYFTKPIDENYNGEIPFDINLTDVLGKLSAVYGADFWFKPSKLSLIIANLDGTTTIASYPIFSIGTGTGIGYNANLLESTDMDDLNTGLQFTYTNIPISKNIFRDNDFTVKIETPGEADDQWTGFFVIEGSFIDLDL